MKEEQLQERGHADTRIVEFGPHRDGEPHTHKFPAMVVVTRGEPTPVYKDGPVTYTPGDWCEVEAGKRRFARTGPDAATALPGNN